ncbi:MAG: hypothetical protein U0T36_03130 [Saprospiraceae bacterium]
MECLRLVDGWETDGSKSSSAADDLAAQWMQHKMASISVDIDKNFKEYRP